MGKTFEQKINDLTFTPSTYQRNILEAMFHLSQQDHMIIRARAGTGKTTILETGLTFIPAHLTVRAMAFGKDPADELNARVARQGVCQDRVKASSLHSFGFGEVKNAWGKRIRVDSYREHKLLEIAIGEAFPDMKKNPKALRRLGTKLAQVVQYAKGVFPFATEEDMEECILVKNCAPDNGSPFTMTDYIGFCLRSMELSERQDGSVSFADMVWLPVRLGLVSSRYDVILIDECQDMSPAQILLARMALKPSGTIIVVGDDRQAIFGFRGADSKSLDRLKDEFQAREFNLPVTYRCGSAIVEHAKELVADYEAGGKHEGAVPDVISVEEMIAQVEIGDAILSRLNAPLGSLAMKFLREGKPVRIAGKDIGSGLLRQIGSVMGDKSYSRLPIVDFFERLETYESTNVEKIANTNGRNVEERIGRLQDECETLRVLAEGCATIWELENRIKDLFQINKKGRKEMPCILLSSVHKAKGKEWNRVFGLVDTLYTFSRDEEEENIDYVMRTRAKDLFQRVIGANSRD